MLKRHEVLFKQLADYRHELLVAVDSMNEDEVNIVPEGFRNNIRWNLGHVYLDQYLWIQHLTKEPIILPNHFNEWFGYGTSPEDWRGEVPKLDYLKRLLAVQPFMIRDLYGERLEEEYSVTESGMFTVEQVLVRTIFHEGIHLGNILALKKLVTSQEVLS
ncbi:DinB family protein [Pradoshia sp. D12]|uniref:DinB family protein n=1 Tax=Bacillaceae TaxID=186817 RepID=UPI00080AEBCD|nr:MULTISPECIES: DinB family protein [Bacillaceae]OCA89527.1 hypothetical protein A8L44_00835 [Bacillus sp. FJAT-27986]QFK71093.1 DinB family protein [Pradoshia sp. D12]TPF72885.1 DinB family protein [Bacillus sp. D12]